VPFVSYLDLGSIPEKAYPIREYVSKYKVAIQIDDIGL
jgi:hypothetical protein